MADRPSPTARYWTVAGLWLLLWTVGCGGTVMAPPHEVPDVEVVAGARVTIGQTRLTMAIPKGFEKKSDEAWMLSKDNKAAILLRFVKHPTPASEPDVWIDGLVKSVQRAGRAGVLQDQRVTLGDLEARHIGIEDLLGQPRGAVRMVVVPAEDGVYAASFLADAATIRKHTKVLDEALLSLRVPALK